MAPGSGLAPWGQHWAIFIFVAVWLLPAHLSIQSGLRGAELVGAGDGVSRREGVA
jgi:hypothetical protein